MLNFVTNFPVSLWLLLFSLPYLIFWIYAFLDVLKSDFRAPHAKLTWILFLFFLHPFGPFMYFLMAPGQKENGQRSKYFESSFKRKARG